MKSFVGTTDCVRKAMLEALGDPAPASCNGLCQRIRHASDMQHLWHMRGELMLALALMRGEASAADALARITPLFEEGLPRGLAGSLHRSPLSH